MSFIVKVQSQKCLSLFPLNYELINVLIVPAGISNFYDEFHEEPSVYIIDVYRYNLCIGEQKTTCRSYISQITRKGLSSGKLKNEFNV